MPSNDRGRRMERVYVINGELQNGLVGIEAEVVTMAAVEVATLPRGTNVDGRRSFIVGSAAWRSPEEARGVMLKQASESLASAIAAQKAAARLVINIGNGQVKVEER